MKYFISASFLILFSCGTQNSISGFESYVNEFSQYAKKYNKVIDTSNLSIEFGETKEEGEDVVGLCYTYENSKDKEIVLDKEFWDSTNEIKRKELLFHELGHCILDKRHDKTIINPPGRPKSIMYPYVISTYWIENYFEEYIAELFSN